MLHKGSDILLELTTDFIAKATQLQIASFYGMKMTRIGLMKKMVRARLDFFHCEKEPATDTRI